MAHPMGETQRILKCAAAGSQEPDLSTAVSQISETLLADLAGLPADLTFVFVSHHHRDSFPSLAASIQRSLPSRVLLGATADAVVNLDQEWEQGPALSVWTASLPDSTLIPFRVSFESTPDGIVSTGIPDHLENFSDRLRGMLVLGEPYSSAPHALIERFADDCPGVPVVGGMASGGRAPGENRLWFADHEIHEGTIGVALVDGPRMQTLVSQGCRPVGEPFVVTNAEKNVVLELGGKPALQRVQEVYQAASAKDRQLLESGLHLGVAMTEYRETFGRGDFLIANVLGADRVSGAIATGQFVRKGQTVQFHIRDAESADADLTEMLSNLKQQAATDYAGGLLFSCNGRGSRMFPTAHHDAAAIQRALGPLPLSGMFAAGEFGPVGPQTYLHGYTASLALLTSS